MCHIVLAVMPKSWNQCQEVTGCVALVTSVWHGTKKPKLATTAISINHAMGIRVVTMTEGERGWTCNARSDAVVLRPQTIVAILEVAKDDGYEETADGITVQLSEKSNAPRSPFRQDQTFSCADFYIIIYYILQIVMMFLIHISFMSCCFIRAQELTKEMRFIAAWWPSLEEESGCASNVLSGMVLPGNGRKRKKKPAKKAHHGKAKKVFIKKPKKGAAAADVPAQAQPIPQNFRRTPQGEILIKQVVEKLRKKDDEVFPDARIWNADDLCKFKAGKCFGQPWSSFLNGAFKYFRAEHLS